jgi:glutathione peroxidase
MVMPRCRPALVAVALAAVAIAVAGCGDDPPSARVADPAPAAPAADVSAPGDRGPEVLRSPIRLLDGTRLAPVRLRGRVVLAVNTASRCGFTPQFEGLEALYRSRSDRGLVVVGFPSNDFRQELARDADIADFCTLSYGVSFPMAARSHVTGPNSNPLFAAIAARPGPAGEPPGWNFTKYLLDRDGRLVARFDSSVEPDDPGLLEAVDGLLAEPEDL